jgi:predicted nucleic acid-binding protein
VPANLFIDTNILLSFYHFTSDDLEELSKLATLVQKGEIVLLVPQQVIDEFRRNRDAKIADALKTLRAQKLAFQFPQMCKDYPEYEQLRQLQRDHERAQATLVQAVLRDASTEHLKADDVVNRLFQHGRVIKTTEEILSQARERMDLGNPPGKTGSLGDAVNWEALFDGIPDGQPLHFVTDDKDYWSALDSNTFNAFLIDEWTGCKESALHAYRRLSDFFTEDFPEIKLAGELEKDELIERFSASPNFTTTHSRVAQLRRLGDFTISQANAILSAVVDNDQIGWIAADWDVREFLKGLIAGREADLDPQLLREVQELMGPEPDPFPF